MEGGEGLRGIRRRWGVRRRGVDRTRLHGAYCDAVRVMLIKLDGKVEIVCQTFHCI